MDLAPHVGSLTAGKLKWTNPPPVPRDSREGQPNVLLNSCFIMAAQVESIQCHATENVGEKDTDVPSNDGIMEVEVSDHNQKLASECIAIISVYYSLTPDPTLEPGENGSQTAW